MTFIPIQADDQGLQEHKDGHVIKSGNITHINFELVRVIEPHPEDPNLIIFFFSQEHKIIIERPAAEEIIRRLYMKQDYQLNNKQQ